MEHVVRTKEVIDAATHDRLAAMAGLIDVTEGEQLARLAAQVPADRTIVEVGSYWGLSTCWLAHGAKVGGAHVVAIDPWVPEGVEISDGEGVGDHTLERFRSNIGDEDLWDRVTALRIRSPDAANHWVNPIGMAFIDGLHGYWDVMADAQAWAPRVEVGGFLVFHDYYDDFGTNAHPSEVAQAIEDLVVPMGCWDDVDITYCTWSARRAA